MFHKKLFIYYILNYSQSIYMHCKLCKKKFQDKKKKHLKFFGNINIVNEKQIFVI